MPTTYFILAGEASGDLHAAKLMAAWKTLEPDARFIGMGGPKMATAGLEVAKDLDGMQVVGFWEVAKRYGFFKQVFHKLLDRVKQERPAALICIDYPGFNLRFAKEVRKLGIPCLYYIVPQVWAWKPKRAGRMAEYIDRAYCVFSFEPPFFDKFRAPSRKMKTLFVGHPLLDQTQPPKLELPKERQHITLLPGSRISEFEAHGLTLSEGFHAALKLRSQLVAFMSLSPKLRTRQAKHILEHLRFGSISNRPVEGAATEFVAKIIMGPAADESKYLQAMGPYWESTDLPHASFLPALADFSVVKSGTSTLEAGLQGNPMCVVYKGDLISFAIARLLVDIPCFSLVNIVLGRYAVPELLQSEVNPQRIAAEIERGITDQRYIEQQRAALSELPGKLGGPGASQRAAKGMLNFLRGKE